MTDVDLDRLLDALLWVGAGGSGNAAYVCSQTGAVYVVAAELDEFAADLPDDLESNDRYLQVPDQFTLNLGRGLAYRFAREYLPEATAQVHECFRGKGGYARFKGLLDRHNALERWYEFEARETQAALRQWCREHGLACH